jgi:hypothetical protein
MLDFSVGEQFFPRLMFCGIVLVLRFTTSNYIVELFVLQFVTFLNLSLKIIELLKPYHTFGDVIDKSGFTFLF